jgi:hypothetical protein
MDRLRELVSIEGSIGQIREGIKLRIVLNGLEGRVYSYIEE